MPLAPEIVEQLRESGQLQKFIDRMEAAKAKGVCQPFTQEENLKFPGQRALSFNPDAVDTIRVIVILADFSDNEASGGQIFATVSDFDDLLFNFDTTDNRYSMSEYYSDNSYGDFYLEGVVVGWYRLPQTYAYYVDGNNGFGSYPNNAQRMAEDAITLADPTVDYSQFDNDNDGWCDGVFIVHAGTGAESTSSDYQIWSHSWSTSYTMNLDGINISGYTTEPEEMSGQLITHGVFSHEYGHFLGVPDLYDTDYSSSGVGDWTIMASGSWNLGGRYPAFFDAWCKKELGFVDPINVTSNQPQVEIASAYHTPTVYRLWENGNSGDEYFLIENRQKTGNDRGIPGSGLLIYHIDDSQGGNWDETHYLVAVEQADGEFDLENKNNQGDDGDVWTVFTNNEFSDLSTPNSDKYNGQKTKAAVWDISASDSLMYANLDISYSSPRFTVISSEFSDSLYGNNNGVVEVGETITFTFSVNNLWLTADNVTGEMSSDNLDIIFTTSSSNIGTVNGEGGSGSNNSNPIVFDVPITFDPCIDSFYLDISSDNPLGDLTIGFELQVGTPEVVIIDDDNGDTWELEYTNTLRNFRIPYDVYDKSQSGSPTASYLNNYGIVIWMTGDDRADLFSAADITSMTDFMDNGGNMFLTGQSVAGELSVYDQTFLQNYFKADYDADYLFPLIEGQDGTNIGGGINLRYDSYTNQTSPEKMTLFGGDGVSEFEIPVGGVLGISYDGSYKSLLFSFGFEAISDNFESSGYATKDTVMNRIMKFFEYGDVNEFSNPNVDTILLPNEISVSSVIDHTPTFYWSYSDTSGGSQQQYQIQVGSGNFCFNANDLWDSGILTGAEDSIVYAGAPLEDGILYYVRIRVYNGSEWSNWRRTSFTMNMAPTSGTAVSPIDDNVVVTGLPELIINNGFDVNNDLITYEFELYSDISLSTLVTSSSSISEGTSTTSWTVDVSLDDNMQYFWRCRPSDPYENGSYSETSSFYVNTINQAPSQFSLVSPLDDSENIGLTPTFNWMMSTDSDPGDLITYSLVYSDDSLFTAPTEISSLTDTSYTITTPLLDDVIYFWKVYALDIALDTTWSSETFSFNSGSPECCIGIRGNIDNSPDDLMDIADIVYMVAYMFGSPSGPAPVCTDEADVDATGELDIADLVYVVAYSFQGGPQPLDCP